jgi:hypothetical protein
MSRPSRNPLPAWQMSLLAASALVLLATGLAWLLLHYAVGGELPGLPHRWEATAMKLHGAAMFTQLFVLGALAAAHIPRGWRQHAGHAGGPRLGGVSQRASGVALCVLAAALAASGYALYYLVSEDWRPALGWLHAGLGGAALPAALLHLRRPPMLQN